jgi:hypothetical protein
MSVVALYKLRKALNTGETQSDHDQLTEVSSVTSNLMKTSLKTLKKLARKLSHLLLDRKNHLLTEKQFEASMLCEVDHLNLLNLLNVFEIEVDFGVSAEDDEEREESI